MDSLADNGGTLLCPHIMEVREEVCLADTLFGLNQWL